MSIGTNLQFLTHLSNGIREHTYTFDLIKSSSIKSFKTKENEILISQYDKIKFWYLV